MPSCRRRRRSRQRRMCHGTTATRRAAGETLRSTASRGRTRGRRSPSASRTPELPSGSRPGTTCPRHSRTDGSGRSRRRPPPPSHRRRRPRSRRAESGRRSRSARRPSPSCSSGSDRRGHSRGGGAWGAGRPAGRPRIRRAAGRSGARRSPMGSRAAGWRSRAPESPRCVRDTSSTSGSRDRACVVRPLRRLRCRRPRGPQPAAAATGRRLRSVPSRSAARNGRGPCPGDQVPRRGGAAREWLVGGRGRADDDEPEDEAEEQRGAHEVRTVADDRRRLRASCEGCAT